MESGYIYVIAVLAVTALSSFVIYDEQGMRHSRFALGVLLLSALIVPMVSAVKNFSAEDFDFSYGAEYSSDTEKRTVEEAFCRGISLSLQNEFSIKESEISVTAEGFDTEKMRAQTVRITLSGSAVFGNLPAIEDYVEEAGLGECSLEVRFG